MKRISLPAAAIALLSVIAASCIGVLSSDKAKMIESGTNYKVFSVEDFNELIASAVDVYVTLGETNPVIRIEADPEIIDGISVEIKSGTVCINDKNNIAEKKNKPKAIAVISVKNLDKVFATAGSTVVFDKPVIGELFNTNSTITVDSAKVAAYRQPEL